MTPALLDNSEPTEAGCGPCTLCCTVMRVEMEPPKREHLACPNCTSRGCAIYADRPEPCRGFECLWLASQRLPGHELPPAMRPDRAGVCIDLNAAGTIIVHCECSTSWTREPIRSWLLDHVGLNAVVLELPDGAEQLDQDGSTERLMKVGVHASGNRLYVRESRMADYLRATAE